LEITVRWDNSQKTIIRQVYSATWDWEEYLASFQRIHDLAGEVRHPIGIIAETSAIRRIPPNALVHGSQAIGGLPKHVFVYVVVSPSRLTLTIARAVAAVTRFNLQVAETDDAARALIEEGAARKRGAC
jgi:hypothetical protein